MANKKDEIKGYEKNKKVTLKKDVKYGILTKKKGTKLIPDRDFYKYLVKHNLIEEMPEKPKKGETEPDIRTRSTTGKFLGNNKSE